MKIIDREHIDTEAWDRTISEAEEMPVFMESIYLDAVAENWCLLSNETYTAGLPLPYVLRAGQKVLYTPIYMRYLMAHELNLQDFLPELRLHFSDFEFSLSEPLEGMTSTATVFQHIRVGEEPLLSTQAKRMLKKAQLAGLEAVLDEDYQTVLQVIESELAGKIRGINQKSIVSLRRLMEAYYSKGRLLVFRIEGAGGIVCIRNAHTLLYLKGAVDGESKKQGAMYLLMNTAIAYARSQRLHFDFGGSRAEGVKKFNHNLGAKDCVYYQIIESGGPLWYRLAKKWKRKWIRK